MTIKGTIGKPLLALINRLLALFSLKLVPKGTPTRDFYAFCRHIKNNGVDFKTVIDVGVAFGSPALYESFPKAKFYLIDPVPSCKGVFAKLQSALNAETFSVAAGSRDGVLDFFVHSDTSGSSHYRQWEGDYFDGEKISVPVRRLDSVVKIPLVRPCLLKIDTQGAELEVLDGATGLLGEVDVVIVEASFHEFRKNAPEFNSIVTKLSGLEFECYEVLEGHYRTIDDALAQVDLVFVRPDSILRRNRGFFSIEQARHYVERTARSSRIP